MKGKKIISAVLTVSMVCSAWLTTQVSAEQPEFDIAAVNFAAMLTGEDQQAQNLALMKEDIAQAIDAGNDIVLFPEYTLTSSPQDAVDVRSDAGVQEIAAVADINDLYVLFGAVISEDERYYSAMVICDPDGDVDTYKKIHLTDEEAAEGFSAGEEPYVLSTEYGSFGLALGNEFADVAELGKYYYGAACRMILVGQSYGYDPFEANGLTQAQYDLYTSTYAFLRMYSRPVAVANLFTNDGNRIYFGESHVCTGYQNGWIAGGNDSQSAPAKTVEAGIVSASIPKSARDTANGMSGRRLNLLANWYGRLTDYDLPDYGADSPYKDTARVASVNFKPVWGDLDANVAKIKALMQSAYEDGVELLVFPEMALTGYAVVFPEDYSAEEKALYCGDYMQHVLAQVVRGDHPSKVIRELQQLAESYGMYVLIGLPEQDEIDPDTYWNSVAILGPDHIQSYRKVNLAFPEPNWSAYGTENDGIFETPFGYVGVAICADIYNYQELQRTYSEMGCRIVINCTAGAANNTAVENGGWQLSYQNRLESFMLRDDSFMMTSNLVGYDGPKLTGTLKDKLAEAGYTADDITSSWLYSGNADLYNLINSYDEDAGWYTSLLNGRACVFPGSSVSMALDKSSPTGTRVWGNSADSAAIIDYDAELGPYLDVDGDGRSPYLNYTADTFDTYYPADFDLSQATLEKFYNENAYDYRPDLYYRWYSALFYETYGYSVADSTLLDQASGVSVSGRLSETAKLSVTKDSASETPAIEGYTPKDACIYTMDLSSVITTQVLKTDENNTADGAVDVDYTGAYAPSFSMLDISVPAGEADLVMAYMDGEAFTAADGLLTIPTDKLSELLVVSYQKEDEQVLSEPEPSQPTGSEDPSGGSSSMASASAGSDAGGSSSRNTGSGLVNTGDMAPVAIAVLLFTGAAVTVTVLRRRRRHDG
ncbi:carbon-nitrogen hydrolase family protein [Candidatus Soleaferrea massiliensis]|uniref:carbon-nitrogen hydrolase family protein n=1 Tax=Candidatus Soleaferrea massiliensis TaxID=1470354 RepID=UPI0018CDCE26|nr:carbon-nitrogen hydrolase family protein [Candidatus Soleaferrea massiliensis]